MASVNTARQQLAVAQQHFRMGQHREAEALLRKLAAVDEKNPAVHELLGYVCGNDGRIEECEAHLLDASRSPSCSAEALYYLGKVQIQRGRSRAAISSLQRALQKAGEFFEGLHELGVANSAIGDHERAREFFSRADRKRPGSHELQTNLASTLHELHRDAEALNYYDSATSLCPDSFRAWSGRALVLAALGRHAEAVESYNRALALFPEDIAALMNRAKSLMALGQAVEAFQSYQQMTTLPPSTDYARGYLLLANMHACHWDGWNVLVDDTVRRVDAGEKAAPPYVLLATPAGPATQLTSARTYAQDLYPARSSPPPKVARAPGRKLRVGYFSPDFYNHATAQLIVGILEHADRELFEWYGFSIGPTAADAMTKRIASAFDHFISVERESDLRIAQMARGLELDIAVDLNGFNEGARTSIFAARAAPVQVNYLGYPGTMGCDYMDYIIADAHLIGPEDLRHYAEKVVLMPDSYQPNDDKKQIATVDAGREAFGLPKEGVVFASFNSIFKVTPDAFDVWMRILDRTPGSVLWLLQGSEGASVALRAEAARRGIGPDRIVFAKRAPLAEHLGRHVHADLFLDTFHYNAHTTCSDALWAGLPVLTLRGHTFASRVASSLLRTVGLSQLVTNSVEAYEDTAVALAAAPQELRALRDQLGRNRLVSPLFKTQQYARNMEAALQAMCNQYQSGAPPEHISIRP
jgi:predicted O-linked N-acetylglucosamine transferase (SPINDLY family)